jgi:hypothetical protein
VSFMFGEPRVKRERYVEFLKRLRRHSSGSFPRATREMIAAAERELGFRLPGLLRAVYRFVGNGGFGPGVSGGPIGGGLIGVGGGEPYTSTGQPIEDRYEQYVRDDEQWPEKMVPICDFGCGSFACVDCSRPSARVLLFDCDASLSEMRHVFRMESQSLAAWFEEWLRAQEEKTSRT